MAEVIQVATIMRTLFLADVVPWPSLVVESNIERLRGRYKFVDLAYQANNPAGGVLPQLFATRGEFAAGDTSLLIEQFIVQPLIVQFQIAGDSGQADRFAADIRSFFLEIDPQKNYAGEKELTKTYQTIAVVRLSVLSDRMFSERFSHYLEQVVKPRLAPAETEVDIRLQNVRWMVTYKPATSDFTYLPKPLVIEPRGGSRPSDMTYYTQSPTVFQTHMEMVEALEKALASA